MFSIMTNSSPWAAPQGPLFRGAVRQFDQPANLTAGGRDHGPGQIGNLTGAEAGLRRQQDNEPVSQWVPGATGKHE